MNRQVAVARAVKCTHRATGRVLHGVQDVASGVVYPFLEEDVREVASEVNSGEERLSAFSPVLGQSDFDIEEVAS